VADREAEELPDTEEVAEGEGERELLVLGLTLVLPDFDAVGLTETEEVVEGERTGDRVLEVHLDALLQPDAVELPDALREGELLTLGEALAVEHTDSVGESVGVTVTEADLLGLALLLGEEDERCSHRFGRGSLAYRGKPCCQVPSYVSYVGRSSPSSSVQLLSVSIFNSGSPL
jgi:hypothetical protein